MLSLSLSLVTPESLYAGVTPDLVRSTHIREADNTTGQDTNQGSGVKTGHLQNAAVTAEKIAGDAVTTSKILDGTIGPLDLANGAVTSEKLSFPVYTEAEVDTLIAGLASDIADLQSQVVALQQLLQHFSRAGNEITISGANLNLNNGTGSSWSTNGLGNLTVGYNELRNDGSDSRSGSHNIVRGIYNNYNGYCGSVGGEHNQIGLNGVVLNGYNNSATGSWATIVTGLNNASTGTYSLVASGEVNSATGLNAVVMTGFGNLASGTGAAVGGGWGNVADGTFSVVGGGRSRGVSGDFDWTAGSLWETE